ncbi:MAG: hypothetical protein UV82_C0007G0015 [Candidatus Magasanikbacteria bacterium GW2011_GWD2_43_18]|nr:MAG: hypothetical protein UV18_C0009G0021 [Candidatus Magasanikbacteria bacterium GW2011_GWC2_42_27]KKT04515.1 MAG: hypothetical protein UV82_C0007G0015 [Candidatus Magasanikbacteria bacterium GW2011_GWD2_43_18]HCC13783.1 hypothetical protein [Candidatus Magasanikbacteria bacterium]
MEKSDYQNQLQDERLDRVEKTVNEIKENHLSHIQNDLTKVSTDVDWLKRFFWIIATASVGGLITAIINLLLTINK